MSHALTLHHIRKTFGPLTALDDVSLTLAPGRIHGLLGENGAGKSTLMNVLYGLLRPDGGEILIDGKPTRIRSPRDALASGIGMVHQHFMLGGAMTSLDNVLLGDKRARIWLDRAAFAKNLRELSNRLGLPIDPSAHIGGLSVGQQQRVEILKALYRDVRVLILDEPTAVLTPDETDQLFTAVSRLRSEGKSIVFISHKLKEIKRICDDLTVLRRGKVVFQGTADSVSPIELSRLMVGRDIAPVRLIRDITAATGAMALEVRSLSAPPLRDCDFQIRRGEILGIAGVDGNGQQELAEAILGLRPISGGRIHLADREITSLPASDRLQLGIAHIPNDRKSEGLVGSMSIAENLALKHGFARHGLMRWPTIRRTARQMIEQFSISTLSPHAPVATLSGGNQQKVILARELALSNPKIVIAMNPARGLDVAATQFVYEQLLACRSRGGAVLLIGSELDELLALCDRIGVLYSGRFAMSDFPGEGADQIGRMMTGTAL